MGVAACRLGSPKPRPARSQAFPLHRARRRRWGAPRVPCLASLRAPSCFCKRDRPAAAEGQGGAMWLTIDDGASEHEDLLVLADALVHTLQELLSPASRDEGHDPGYVRVEPGEDARVVLGIKE